MIFLDPTITIMDENTPVNSKQYTKYDNPEKNVCLCEKMRLYAYFF